MNPDWDSLKSSCFEVNNCSESLYSSTRNQRLRSDIKKKQKKIDRVFEAAKEAYDPNDTPQQFVESILALLAPWIFRFLISAFERAIIEWIKNRTFTNGNG